MTLARTRPDRSAAKAVPFLREHGRDELGEVGVREARLYRSVLGPRGPAYDAVHVAKLEA